MGISRIEFENSPDRDHAETLRVTPKIDGVSLVELARQYELSRGYQPAGGYGGIIPEFFNYGPLRDYLRGRAADRYWEAGKGYYILGCGDCSEVGCWPLTVRIRNDHDHVIWEAFGQEHRPTWDYSGFGPFMFELNQYNEAVEDVAKKLGQ